MRKMLQVAVVVILLFAGALVMPNVSPGLAVQEERANEIPRSTIGVSGNGQVSVQPDAAVVRLGVQTEAEDAAVALTENGQQMQTLVDVLKDTGIPAEEIQTQVVRLHPRYEEQPGDEDQRELVGYTATNVVEVRLGELEAVGGILDAAVQAGGNRIEGIRFEVSEPAAYLDEAREAAWNDARHKAEQLADLAGVELGEVLTIKESGRGPQPMVERPMAVEVAAAVPIEPGSQTIEVDLQVTWQLRGNND